MIYLRGNPRFNDWVSPGWALAEPLRVRWQAEHRVRRYWDGTEEVVGTPAYRPVFELGFVGLRSAVAERLLDELGRAAVVRFTPFSARREGRFLGCGSGPHAEPPNEPELEFECTVPAEVGVHYDAATRTHYTDTIALRGRSTFERPLGRSPAAFKGGFYVVSEDPSGVEYAPWGSATLTEDEEGVVFGPPTLACIHIEETEEGLVVYPIDPF